MYTQMTNLTAYTTEDGIELQIDNVTGESFASQRAIARMCEVDAVYIRRFVSGTNVEGKTAEILTDAGLRSGTLHSEDTILLCIAKYNPQLMILLSKAGLRVYLHGLAGFKTQTPKETVLTPVQAIIAMALQLGEQERQQTQILARLQSVEVEQERFNTPCGSAFSILGFAKLHGLEINLGVASSKGKKASALCKQRGIEMGSIRDYRFGKVNLYPESILKEVFKVELPDLI